MTGLSASSRLPKGSSMIAPVGRAAGDRVAHARAPQVAAAGKLEVIVGSSDRDPWRAARAAGEHRLREELAEFLAGHDPLHVAIQLDGQVVGVRGMHQPHAGIGAQQEGGEPPRDQLALAVLRRHEDHQPPALAAGHTVQPRRQLPVVPVGAVVGLGEKRERQEPLLRLPDALVEQSIDTANQLMPPAFRSRETAH
jgi:hypothetical protein